MVDNPSIVRIISIVGTVLLGMVFVIMLFEYIYIDIRHLYRDRKRRWWIGLLAFLLPLTGLLAGIGVLMIWNPLVRPLLWPLVIFAGVVSIILWQSIISPYEMADWWSKVGVWLKKRNKKG